MPSRLKDVVEEKEGTLLSEWMKFQLQTLGALKDRISESELRTNLHDFVLALKQGLASGSTHSIEAAPWTSLRDMLSNLSRQRATQGFTPAETAMFVFSFKPVIFNELRKTYEKDPAVAADEILNATELLDKLGLFTMEVYQKTREAVILRQEQEMLERSNLTSKGLFRSILWRAIASDSSIGVAPCLMRRKAHSYRNSCGV
jgi:rsbT co-antagonist protein RsbR